MRGGGGGGVAAGAAMAVGGGEGGVAVGAEGALGNGLNSSLWMKAEKLLQVSKQMNCHFVIFLK